MTILEKVSAVCGILSAILVLRASHLVASNFPKRNVVENFEGKSIWAVISLNGMNFNVVIKVNQSQIAILSRFPSIGLTLNISELKSFKIRSFLGSRFRIISEDPYVNHMFKEMIISHRAAKKIRAYSSGRFELNGI